MKIIVAILMISFLQQYAFALKTPRSILFTKEGKPDVLVKFTEKLKWPSTSFLTELRVKQDYKVTDYCDIFHYSPHDKKSIVFSHTRLQYETAQVYINDNLHHITAAHSFGQIRPFIHHYEYGTTLVYDNSEDCHARKEPLRILIGVYRRDTPVYSTYADMRVGWDLNTDKAYLYLSGDMVRAEVMFGKVIDWY